MSWFPSTACPPAFAALLMFAGCAGRVAQAPSPSSSEAAGWSQHGEASWYGHPFHGRTTANGEVYDMYKHTAAHRTLPFGSRVQVTDLDTGRRTQVRINDRGPFVEGRVIDLSLAAARDLDMVGRGVVPVKLRLMESGDGGRGREQQTGRPQAEAAPTFAVQAGAFSDAANAQRLADRLRSTHPRVSVLSQAGLHKVLVAGGLDREGADRLCERLRKDGHEAFVVAEATP